MMKLEADELKSVFLSENPNLKISEKDLDYIVNSANKNPAMLNIIVNYLKGRTILPQEREILMQAFTDGHTCEHSKRGLSLTI